MPDMGIVIALIRTMCVVHYIAAAFLGGMERGMDADEVVKVRIHVDEDGAFCALDANDTLIAQHEDFAELSSEIGEIIRMAYGQRARPILVVG
jgi:hypothetical protein